VSQRIVLWCIAIMIAAGLATYPLGLIGWEGAAGVAFIVAMLVAWIAAAAGFLRKLWD
jgi:hypothetical protein